jgi:hypothetical protein
MGGKHGKYAYVRRKDGWFVKVRVFKSRGEGDPDRYLPLSFKTREPPRTYRIIDEEDLPEEAARRLYEV